MKFILLLFILVSMVLETVAQKNKMNGISLVSINAPFKKEYATPLIELDASYASVIPFGFKSTVNGTSIQFDMKNQWYGETQEGIKQSIKLLQEQQLKIMIKPQIWIWNGTYTGDIRMKSNKDWIALEESYTKFIMTYAQIAVEVKAEMFCIGTELKLFASARPDYFKNLIKDIRKIYSGQLTYAANWDEYAKVRFWDELDFIGIDAYFPVSFKKTPTVEDCTKGWKKHKAAIKFVAKAYNKKVVFTEFGYRSIDFTGKEPWNSDNEITKVNLKAQSNATEALMDVFWSQEWFAGGFLWKWHPDNDTGGGKDNSRFTPQNKPVIDVIKSCYKREEIIPESK